MRCSNCGTENREWRSFCSQCGAKLQLPCRACGAANDPEDRFCGNCGAALEPRGETSASAQEEVGGRAAPAAERRLVSVLFADLVGFSTWSESRDAEEVRELLTRYFETARRIMSRYGGTIEKFIGDAVMSVWGTPVAQEDDAERAVRAALDLTTAVEALAQEVGSETMELRAGVVTGEAAVTVGAEGQGMVAGDLVNTASRVQSIAPPGGVLVTDSTRRVTEAAIVYEDAGSHELKGKTDTVRLWRATRVIGSRRGAQKAVGLEAPFVGREREMHLVKELFHSGTENRKAHLLSVVGIAGIGKSRLSWEFEKYIDGLADVVLWHRGRCLAYGEGVTYWALSEMIRMRAGIPEEENPDESAQKLRAVIDEIVDDEDERRWIEPRLANLLGMESRSTSDRQELFSAWRLFVERMAEQGPTVLVFEDLQWADAGLLDFIDYLLEWSRDHPLFILTLARPEIAERRPDWGAGPRNSTSLFLEPLSDGAMDLLVRGYVPGLPEDVRTEIRKRAEGVPLYAVETVRMLLDRGVVERVGDEYRLVGSIDRFEVPESLHALISARLDGLSPDERTILQDASVLGKTFTRSALSALTGIDEIELDPLLTSLVRKELLGVQSDPRSPERGQYGFLQALVQRVAYERLSKRERKSRHLTIAGYLETSWAGDANEIVEVIASHLVSAYHEFPEAEDALEIKSKARDKLVRAGERAASLAAHDEAERYFKQGAELADDPVTTAELLERASEPAGIAGRADESYRLQSEAIAMFESEGKTHAAARVSAKTADVLWDRGEITEAVERMERSFEVLRHDEPDEDLAALASQVGRLHFFTGDNHLAAERIEFALDIAERLWLPEILSQTLNTKSLVMHARGRYEESAALLRHALQIALENDLQGAAVRGYYNLVSKAEEFDRYEEAMGYHKKGLELCRRLGNAPGEWFFYGTIYSYYMLGKWDAFMQFVDRIPPADVSVTIRTVRARLCMPLVQLLVHRGEIAEAKELLEGIETSEEQQEQLIRALSLATIANAEGNHRAALDNAERALVIGESLGYGGMFAKEELIEALDAALALGELDKLEELLDRHSPMGSRPATLTAAAVERFRARLQHARGREDEVASHFKRGEATLRELGTPFYLAVTLLDHGEWLAAVDEPSAARPLLEEARETFESLGCKPWLERLARIEPSGAELV
jgi:class 3 adenylate cyclase/tetratricopeptide (TPR) repeat protein